MATRSERQRKFLADANDRHNFFYYYIKVDYINSKNKVVIICPVHGEFLMSPDVHLRHKGPGCRKCSNVRIINRDNFISESNKTHSNYYNYELVPETLNIRPKVKIICPDHGKFQIVAQNHLYCAQGCRRCARYGKLESEWLDSLSIPTLKRQVRITIGNNLYVVDGYDPDTNTIYEFYGDMWHGNIEVYNSNGINPVNKQKYGTYIAVQSVRQTP